jgi:hypothetical protein
VIVIEVGRPDGDAVMQSSISFGHSFRCGHGSITTMPSMR